MRLEHTIAGIALIITLCIAAGAWGFDIGSRLVAAEVGLENHKKLHVHPQAARQLLRIEKQLSVVIAEMREVRAELVRLREER